MAEFVESLAPVCSISEAIGKLHRVTQVLSNVAQLYVEAKSQQLQDQDMTMVGNDFDMYLSQLGFISAQEGGGGVGGSNAQGGEGMNGGEVPSKASSAGDGGANTIGGGVGFAGMDINQHTSQLGNWFSGNRTILGLVEADLSEFEPRGWGAMGGGP